MLVWERGDSANSFKMAGLFSSSIVLSPRNERAAGGGALSDWSLCWGFCRAAGKSALVESDWFASNWSSLLSAASSLGMSKDSLLNLREGEKAGKQGERKRERSEGRGRKRGKKEGRRNLGRGRKCPRKGKRRKEGVEKEKTHNTREVKSVALTCCCQLPGASQWR